MKRTQGNRQAIGKTVLPEVNYTAFTEASISEEPSAVIPHAGICAGAVR